MGNNHTSQLTVRLVDDVSKPARSVAQALQQAERNAKAVAKAMDGAGASNRFASSLSKLSLSAKDIEKVSVAWKDYAKSAGLAANSADWTKAQASAVRAWETQTISALRAVKREQASYAKSVASMRVDPMAARMGVGRVDPMAARMGRWTDMRRAWSTPIAADLVAPAARDTSGRRIAAGILGTYAAHKTAEFAHSSLDTYREFDKERRYGAAVMGLNFEQQRPLIEQAIHGGATSKFNDIQWPEAQRTLASRGLKTDQVLALTKVASTLGTATDKSLPDAAKILEGGLFGFGKDTSTYGAALANAKRTADLQVKASKAFGLDPEDLVGGYKFAAAPFHLAGLSEETMLSFIGLGHKANFGGDEMGTAGRALVANLLKPTAGARTALMANGIDYSKYQTLGTKKMNAADFASSVAQSYGVSLSKKAKTSIQKVFDDSKIVGDANLFMPAMQNVLGKVLGGNDAKSKGKIAQLARGYRDASVSGVDTNRLFGDIMKQMQGNPALANAVFGSKQGARIITAMQELGLFAEKLDELKNHSEGYAQNVADQRMAGFDGAVSRFEGAVKNLETAVGRAFDNEGKGGFLTGLTDAAAKATQSLAELPPQAIRAAAEVGALAAAFAGVKGFEALAGGFGLKTSATALTEAALALKGSAAHLNGGAAPGGAETKGKKPGAAGTVNKIFGALGALEAANIVSDYIGADKSADDFMDPEVSNWRKFLELMDPGIASRVAPTAAEKQRQAWEGSTASTLPTPAGWASKAGQEAATAKDQIDQLGAVTVTPTVNASSIMAATQEARALNAELAKAQSMISGMPGLPGRIRSSSPSFGDHVTNGAGVP